MLHVEVELFESQFILTIANLGKGVVTLEKYIYMLGGRLTH